MNPISIIVLLDALNILYGNNDIHEGAAMCLIPCIMRKTAAGPGTALLPWNSKPSDSTVKEVLIPYSKEVSHLLKTYVTDDIIGEMDSQIALDAKPLTILRLKLDSDVWLKALRCPRVYDEYVPKVIFIEGLPQCIAPVCEHTVVDTRLNRYRRWHIAPHLWRNCKQQHTEWSSQPCTNTTGASRILFKSYRPQGTITNISSSISTWPFWSYNEDRVQVPAVSHSVVGTSVHSTPPRVNMESTDIPVSAPYCRLCQHSCIERESVHWYYWSSMPSYSSILGRIWKLYGDKSRHCICLNIDVSVQHCRTVVSRPQR